MTVMQLIHALLGFSPGATATNMENVAPAENEAYQLQSPHMSSQWQESLVTGMTAPKLSTKQ
jgi:hypothetical protein